MELKEGRAVMFKAGDEERHRYLVKFNLDGNVYTIPLYPNVDRNENIYYGGNIINNEETE